MKNSSLFHVFVAALFSLFYSSCNPASSYNIVSSPGTSETPPVEMAPTNVWTSLLVVTPVPYASPLPGPDATPLDGTYARFDPNPPQWWSCLRCADYRPAGGSWRIQFDRGVMRIYYEVTGWKSLASYTVSGDSLFLYNDPYCKESTGEYKWNLVDGRLRLEVIEDPCSFQLRGRNLSNGAWEVCPKGGSAIGEKPRGCRDPMIETLGIPELLLGLKVEVHEADVRLTGETPDVIINASGANRSMPEGVRLSFSDDSIYYGNNRVLWTNGDWMEFTSDAPYTSMGVQFRGDYVIGWARVLFDGEEVWRGDTARIWSELKVHGGYIEVTGFEPGEHTLRVERLDVDSRPVVVAFFGLDR